MFDNILHIIYFNINEYIDVKSLLFVSKGIQSIMNQYGYVRSICYNERICDVQTFAARCSKHHCMLNEIIYMNVRSPFVSTPFLLNIKTIVLDNCYITDQLKCFNHTYVKELILKRTYVNIRKCFPNIEVLELPMSEKHCHGCFKYDIQLDREYRHLQELYIRCQYRVTLPVVELPSVKTIMIHGLIKKVTSPNLENLVCSTIYEETFVSLCVDQLNLFINGFGIHYKQLTPRLLTKLSEWETGMNKNMQEMCKYIHLTNYKHKWDSGITPTQFMKTVIHKYKYRDSTIIYRGVKKLSVIPKDGLFNWGFEEIAFDP